MPILFSGTFVELSNLRRKFALSTNFDSWFTYCVLSHQNSVSVEFVIWLFWLRKFSVWQSKIAATPPPFLYYWSGWFARSITKYHFKDTRTKRTSQSSLTSKNESKRCICSSRIMDSILFLSSKNTFSAGKSGITSSRYLQQTSMYLFINSI